MEFIEELKINIENEKKEAHKNANRAGNWSKPRSVMGKAS